MIFHTNKKKVQQKIQIQRKIISLTWNIIEKFDWYWYSWFYVCSAILTLFSFSSFFLVLTFTAQRQAKLMRAGVNRSKYTSEFFLRSMRDAVISPKTQKRYSITKPGLICQIILFGHEISVALNKKFKISIFFHESWWILSQSYAFWHEEGRVRWMNL